jgi:hypothetical protein
MESCLLKTLRRLVRESSTQQTQAPEFSNPACLTAFGLTRTSHNALSCHTKTCTEQALLLSIAWSSDSTTDSTFSPTVPPPPFPIADGPHETRPPRFRFPFYPCPSLPFACPVPSHLPISVVPSFTSQEDCAYPTRDRHGGQTKARKRIGSTAAVAGPRAPLGAAWSLAAAEPTSHTTPYP